MTGLLEFSARAALCRKLARREPDSEIFWLAEAEKWSRLTLVRGVAVKTLEFRIAGARDAFDVFLHEMPPDAAKAS